MQSQIRSLPEVSKNDRGENETARAYLDRANVEMTQIGEQSFRTCSRTKTWCQQDLQTKHDHHNGDAIKVSVIMETRQFFYYDMYRLGKG